MIPFLHSNHARSTRVRSRSMRPTVLTRLVSLTFSAVLLATPATQTAGAETFPSHPVRIIMPLGPGASDNVVRLVGKLVAAELGQPTFIDNRPGADSLLAVQNLLSSPADGYSMMYMGASSMIINPLIVENLPYDAQRDIRPLAGAARTFAVLVTGAKSRFKSFADVIATARAAKKSVSVASYANTYRMAALEIQQRVGIEFNDIPYKSASQVQTDLISNNVDVALMDFGGARELILSGKLKALAVTTKERHPQIPGVPTIRESGVPNYDLYVWTGFGVAAKTPEPAARVLEAALLKAMRQPEFIRYVSEVAGAEVLDISGKELSELIRSETIRYRHIKQLNSSQR